MSKSSCCSRYHLPTSATRCRSAAASDPVLTIRTFCDALLIAALFAINAGARQSAWQLIAALRRLPLWSRALSLVLLLVASSLLLPRGGLPGILAVMLSAVFVVTVASILATDSDRRWLVPVALLATLGRDVLVGLIDVALLAEGRVWYAPDESVYIGRAALIYQHWLDPTGPFNHGDPYVRSWQVHGMARLYQIVGGENTVVVKVVNTALAVAAAILAYRVMRNLKLPGAPWTLGLLLVFPSLAFWSALTLKDAYVIFFLLASLWAASEYIRTRRVLWLLPAVAALIPLESVRMYMFATGAIALLAIPLALARWRDRLSVGAGLLVTVYVLFAVIQPFRDLGANVLYIPIFLRGAAAQGARTAFVEPAPVVQGNTGDRVTISVPGVTPMPRTTPRVVNVRPGTAFVVELATPVPESEVRPVVRPGDIIVIGPGDGAGPARTVVVEPEAKNTVGLSGESAPEQSSFAASLETNVRHLPLGILYTLFAPFPWSARTLEQMATIPEMLLWYVCLAAALFATVTLLWRRDMSFSHGFAMTVGLIIVLSLIGANVGTLIRSRAMLIPYVLILAGVGISLALDRYPKLARPWHALVARVPVRGRATRV